MKASLQVLLIAFGFATAAIAQETAEIMLPKFADVDENEDGKIDSAEAAMLSKSLKESEPDVKFDFKTADANEDGAIDAAEYAKYQEDLNS